MEEKDESASNEFVKECSSSSIFDTRKRNTFIWRNVNFSVASKGDILSNCWGRIDSGTVSAIMGPSGSYFNSLVTHLTKNFAGSGKSSLLDALAGRNANSSRCLTSGQFVINNHEINPIHFRKSFAYLTQQDSLVSTSTPREALLFSAALRLPRGKYRTPELSALVIHTLQELSIEHCADTLIGDDLLKGISGGERKRTSVGVELITNPSIFFLDEPISGLDSYNGYKLIALMKRIAACNAAVLLTIHQPSSEIFHLFDRVIFMKEGRVLFQGGTKDVVPYFTQREYVFPASHNPSDIVMFICETEGLDSLREKKVLMMPPQDSVDSSHSPSPSLEILRRDSDVVSCASLSEQGDLEVGESICGLRPDSSFTSEAAFCTQLMYLSQRGCRSTLRNHSALVSRFGVVVIINLVTSLIFLGAGSKDNSVVQNFNAHVGAVTLVMISAMFNSALPALMEVPSERSVFSREYMSGTYSMFAYSFSKIALDIPLALLQAVLQCVIVYFIIRFQGNLGLIVLTVWITALTSSALAIMLGCLVVDSKQAVELAPLLFPPQILFAGFFISTTLIPIWLRWLQWICPLKYGISLFLMNEFAPFRASCQGDASQNCRDIMETNSIRIDSWWIYSLALLALFFGFRILAAAALITREGGGRYTA